MNLVLSAEAAKLAEELEVESHAEQDGLANSPPAAATAPSGIEEQIAARGKQFANQYIAGARGWAEPVAEQARLLTQGCSDCKEALRRAKTRGKSRDASASESSRRAKRRYEKLQAEYDDFRREAGLRREAVDPNKPAAVMWLMSIIIIEGIFNSYIYAQASALGLVGGFYYAFVISLCNVAFAFIGAFAAMRYLNHVEVAKKFYGLLGTVATVATCIIILLFAALYRVGLERQLDEAGNGQNVDGWQIAVEALRNGEIGLAFATFDSAILLVIGIICMILGIWKGLNFDDPYPGFGALGRALADARAEHEDLLEINAQSQDDGAAQSAATLERLADDLRVKARALQTESEQLRNRMRDLGSLPEDWLVQLRVLIKKYREINNGKRAANPPQYFLEDYPQPQLLAHLAAEINEIQTAPDYPGWQQLAADASRQADELSEAARLLAAT
ncbi:MAG: hypothetical protein OXC81_03035 [Betaproteobacteria bacterium]|nr:hypothetical protein [Betaproteobacteria bacterium]